jgi:MFS family permease
MALQGGEKGIGMALINSAGGVGGFVGPMVIGAIRAKTGGYNDAMIVLGAFLVFAALLTAAFDPKWAERWTMEARERAAAAAAGDVECAVVKPAAGSGREDDTKGQADVVIVQA